MIKTIRIDPAADDANQKLSALQMMIEAFFDADRKITVTIVDESTVLSPQEAADRLGFSCQHVGRMIEAGEIEAESMPGSTHWKISM